MGRPTKYTELLGEKICAGIVAGFSLRKICSVDGFPNVDTLFHWLSKRDHPFSEQYAHARSVQAELLADELIELADDDSGDVTGEPRMPNSVAVQRSRLRVDTRKWVASKLLPKKYGDKQEIEHSGEIKQVLVPDRISTVPSSKDVKPQF